MKFLRYWTASLALVVFAHANFGDGTATSGGGSPTGLNFQKFAAQAINDLKKDLLTPSQVRELRSVLETAKYISVDHKQFVEVAGTSILQDSVATNNRKTKTIYIYEQGWNSMSSEAKRALALHELLSLISLESTGDYHLSAVAFEKSGIEEPNEKLIYERFYDDTDWGLELSSAERLCAYHKSKNRQNFANVYCSYLEKRIPYWVYRERSHHRERDHIEYRYVYGLKVIGLGERGDNSWRTVFSSKDNVRGGAILFADYGEAQDACLFNLAKSLPDEGEEWREAECFVEPIDNKFYYEIRVPSWSQE